MPRTERKKHFAWLNRQTKADPELLAKYQLLKTDDDKFRFLKDCLLAKGDAAPPVAVKETFKDLTQDEQKDKYVTMTEIQLHREFPGEDGAAFIKILKAGQKGIPHPQAPEFSPAKRYRVLKENLNTKAFARSTESEVNVTAEPDDEGKEKLIKTVNDFTSAMDQAISKPMETGKTIKPKKILTPEQQADKDIMKTFKKMLQLPKKLVDLNLELEQVKFTNELRAEIEKSIPLVEQMTKAYDGKVGPDDSLDRKNIVHSEMKQDMMPFDEMIREARKRLPSQKKSRSDATDESEG
ncbi:unnamed protein product [Symbiodinium sp. CCMP2592]|nr:unnamed protein product [Symbiodinium sp. CCMP2592]